MFSYCCSACTTPRIFLFPTLPPAVNSLGWTINWEGTEVGHLIKTDQGDIPYHITLHSAVNSQGEDEEVENVCREFILQSNC